MPVKDDNVEEIMSGLEPIKGATPESTKLKRKMLLGEKKDTMKEKLPDHIRKAYIVIDDKKLNNPIDINITNGKLNKGSNLANFI